MPLAFFLLAALNLHITTGKHPAVARVYITDAAGKMFRIPGTAGYSRRNETHSIVDRQAAIALPPGTYTVRAEKGCEFRSVQKTVTLGTASLRMDLDVPRFHDMNAAGWYSGDLHIHRDPAEMPLLIQAEDLNIGPTITRHVGGTRPQAPPFPAANLHVVDRTHVVSLQNQEVERLYKGHGTVILLNTPQPVEEKLADLFPLDIEFCRRARAQGGFVDGEKPIWKNVPVNLALGGLDAIGVVNNHFHPHAVLLDAEKYGAMERDKPEYQTVAGFAQWMIDLYYSFLNCGFRIPVSAGSASGVMPSWIGYERVYVRLSGPFTYDGWFRDLKAGRSVATNGPLLEVEVDGQPPGAEFPWQGPRKVRMGIAVHSREPIDRVEVVFNGQVIGNQKSSVVEIPEPGWLAVRCFGRAGNTIRYAHSSPFYFPKDGRLPVKKPDAERWASYIRRLAEAADPADYPSREAYEKARSMWKEAEEVYRRKLSAGQLSAISGQLFAAARGPYLTGMNLTHTGAPTSMLCPVGVSLPVFGSIRNTTMLSVF